MDARISAIVSAYYCAPFLRGRIENLRGQECEIVGVAQYHSREHELLDEMGVPVIITTEDVPTIYRAWNLGIQASSGQYITNANSDDRTHPGMLARMADILDKNRQYALVYSDIDMTREIDGEVIELYRNEQAGFSELLSRCFVGPMPMWRKSLHDRYGYFAEEYTVAGDYEFWLRIASKGEKFFYLPEAVGKYVDRPDSAEHRAPVRTIWETARAKRPYKEI